MRELWSVVAAALWGGRWRRLAFGGAMALGLGFVLTACQQRAISILTVNTTHDGHDANPGDGVSAMTSGHHDCSLRAALEEANASTSGASESSWRRQVRLTDGPLVTDPASGSSAVTAGGHGAVIVASGEPVGLEATGGTTLVSGIAVTGASGAGFQVSSGARPGGHDRLVAWQRHRLPGRAWWRRCHGTGDVVRQRRRRPG